MKREFHFAYLYVRCKVYIKILLLREIKAASTRYI